MDSPRYVGIGKAVVSSSRSPSRADARDSEVRTSLPSAGAGIPCDDGGLWVEQISCEGTNSALIISTKARSGECSGIARTGTWSSSNCFGVRSAFDELTRVLNHGQQHGRHHEGHGDPIFLDRHTVCDWVEAWHDHHSDTQVERVMDA
jgi:hypothetical protein